MTAPADKDGRGELSPEERAAFKRRVTELEGDSAGASYGFVKGLGRMLVRMGAGVYELVTHPFPTYKRSYRPVLRSNVPWINGGYEEFPPEFGFQTKRRYTTTSDRY